MAVNPGSANVGDISEDAVKDAACDYAAQDVGNIMALEHLNLHVEDSLAATAFYVAGLGFTRDPYMYADRIDKMAINIGRDQLHLPTAVPAQRLRGTIGVVVPDLNALADRLKKVVPLLKDTQFGYQIHAARIEATCPWGNRLRCHAPGAGFGDAELALAYLEFEVPRGTAAGIARFYRQGFRALVSMEQCGGDAVVSVGIGIAQKLLFRETDAVAPYDGHHIALSIADYSGPYRFFKERGIVREQGQQWRVHDIIDVDSRNVLFELDHEVRSLKHRQFNRPKLNRDPQDKRRFGPFRGVY